MKSRLQLVVMEYSLICLKEVNTVHYIEYLERRGDSVSRLITPITHIVTLVIPLINLLTKSP